jgi:hypothetical protein
MLQSESWGVELDRVPDGPAVAADAAVEGARCAAVR